MGKIETAPEMRLRLERELAARNERRRQAKEPGFAGNHQAFLEEIKPASTSESVSKT